jgi:hypothetical protein
MIVARAMSVTVVLQDIMDALEMQIDEQSSYLDLDTGKVETVSDHLLGEAEEPGDEEPDLSEWGEEEWEMAKKIMASDRFVELPTKFDVHEWQIMEDFSNTVKSANVRADLSHALHGAGAFRHFKHNLQRHGIEKDWYAFRTDALRQIAINWCEENKIVWK